MTDQFQSRDEVVKFIEDRATQAVEKAAQAGPRRVPWVTAGPVGQDSAGYSVLKAAAFALGFVGPDQAKEEIHTHQQLRELYAGYGFSPHHGGQSFLVPLASAHVPVFEPQGRRLQQELHQKMTAHAGRFDPDEADWISRRAGGAFARKALTLAGDTDGFFQLPVLGELIELQRSLEVFAAAGATEVALPPSGRLAFPKVTGSSTAYWVGEGNPITESQPTTGNLELVAKKLGVLVKLNNELLRFASPSAEGLVRFDMARAAAVKADQAMLDGTGGTQIKGLITYPGVAAYTPFVAAANGNVLNPEDVAAMEALLPDAVDAPTAWVMRKALFAALMNRRADAAAEDDRGGPFLFRPQAGALPRELAGTKVVRSGQLAANRVKGAASNLTYAVLGYFPDWVVQGALKIAGILKIGPISCVHGLDRRHDFTRFPPFSVHDSVQAESWPAAPPVLARTTGQARRSVGTRREITGRRAETVRRLPRPTERGTSPVRRPRFVAGGGGLPLPVRGVEVEPGRAPAVQPDHGDMGGGRPGHRRRPGWADPADDDGDRAAGDARGVPDRAEGDRGRVPGDRVNPTQHLPPVELHHPPQGRGPEHE